jgi:hypothetical protein
MMVFDLKIPKKTKKIAKNIETISKIKKQIASNQRHIKREYVRL